MELESRDGGEREEREECLLLMGKCQTDSPEPNVTYFSGLHRGICHFLEENKG